MATSSEISAELCPMEQCEEEHSEGLPSTDIDDGGFLSSSCMETDVKSDPFTSDNHLVFPEDSSRFDTECILSSPLVEGVSIQQTAPCDTSVSSFISGDPLGSCSVLSGSSFLLYDIPGSVPKPANSALQMAPSNVLMGGTDMKGTEQKLDLLSPVQLLTPSAPLSQPHPVVLGNATAASFVKSVLKDTMVLPSTSSTSQTVTTQTVNVPPVMLLNSTLLSPFSIVQSVPGMSSSPLLIQLPPGFGAANTQSVQQQASSLDSTTSQGNTLVTTSASFPIDPTHTSIINVSPESSAAVTFADSFNPSSVSCATLNSITPPVHAISSSIIHPSTSTRDTTRAGESTIVTHLTDGSSNSANASDGAVSSMNLCESPALEVGDNQMPKTPLHPIVISCVKPDDKNSKGMKQILEHFFQQNKMNTSAANTESSHPVNMSLNTNIVDSDGTSASDSADNLKPQVVSLSDFDNNGCNSSLLTVPSLGRKSSSVVFILRRADTQVSDTQCADKLLPGQTASSSAGDRSSSFCPNSIQDEIDGSLTHGANSTMLTEVNSESSESRISLSKPVCSVEPSETPKSAVVNATNSDSSAQYQWVQIQVPGTASLPEEAKTAAGSRTDDLQKLIPLTVNEKLSSDMGRPIIICIIQEDGMMKKVNINPLEINQNAEGKEGADKKEENMDTSSPSRNGDAKTASADSPTIPGGSGQPVSSPPTHTSSPVTPSHSGVESSSSSSSPQTGSESGSPPARVDPSLKSNAREKRYKCDLCTAIFSRLGNYTRHRKIHTLNLKEDVHFKCPYCERPFLQRCDMNRHIAVHTDQYPFRCQTCNKGYIRKSDLVVHERFHSKNRAFKCETCGRSFYQSGDLSRHKRFVHMEQSQLACGHCHRKYASEVTLIRHIKTAHNDILLQSASQHTHQPQ